VLEQTLWNLTAGTFLLRGVKPVANPAPHPFCRLNLTEFVSADN